MAQVVLDLDKKNQVEKIDVCQSQEPTCIHKKEDLDDWIARELQRGSEKAFKLMFDTYYAKLCMFANGYVSSMDSARDVVQDVYVNIWQNYTDFEIKQSLKSYLYQSVRNRSINHINKVNQHTRLKEELTLHRERKLIDAESFENPQELTRQIWEAVENLPEKRKSVFVLYRKHGLSYKEIGEVMKISPKTVENQMRRALKFLREYFNALLLLISVL